MLKYDDLNLFKANVYWDSIYYLEQYLFDNPIIAPVRQRQSKRFFPDVQDLFQIIVFNFSVLYDEELIVFLRR